MKKFLKKNWALIGWVLSIALDQQFQIVETLVKNPDTVKLIYGLGSVILAKLWNTGNSQQMFSRTENPEDTTNPDNPQFPKCKY
ncbi:hypothetical protein [Chryseobacterium sp. EO14]|uniref:hypothetical protein n=1 Tax=Chryseobacterium sp. EO14 TaxID=2950551 RepID=UPI0021088E47|nr:hypothetical protein [Chryseobacterium sp. EO14]MCQ4139243.1 hypothetical protein [Chryseobacterium sp. EO14]